MKKIYLLWSLLLCSVLLNAQVFNLSYKDKEGDTIHFTNTCNILLDPEESLDATFIFFENISGGDLSYYVRFDEMNLAEGAMVQMCFDGSCLSETTSPLKQIGAGETVRNFDLSYIYETTDLSRFKVKFLGEDYSELQSFDVTYSAQELSAPRVEKNLALSLSASPIPASTYTTIKYAIPAQYRSADVIVRNTLGSIVNKYSVPTGKTGKLNVNVSNLNSGIYFYSIVADGKVLSTKKLVVKH